MPKKCVKHVDLIEIVVLLYHLSVLDRAGNNKGRNSNFVSAIRRGHIILPGAGTLTDRSPLGQCDGLVVCRLERGGSWPVMNSSLFITLLSTSFASHWDVLLGYAPQLDQNPPLGSCPPNLNIVPAPLLHSLAHRISFSKQAFHLAWQN